MSAPARPGRGQARQRIVAAATDLFARQGYEATTTRQIAAAAEVTKGALYHWFDSKQQLLLCIYRDLLVEQTERLATLAAAEAPVERRLRDVALDLAEHIAAHAEPLAVWARSMHLLDGEHAAEIRADRRRYHEMFRDLLLEGQNAGVVRRDVSATVMTHTFLSSVGDVHTWFRDDGPLPRREVGRQMVALFLGGVRP
ncbi:TetR/AcrR family transcriptional regulator [Thermomonospora umbrina]|uniref:TetR family transcriptional regulator n=1 Tax=Thermomonospora umbrina TaxID=111806 RepID=A0A3D9SWA9_9ACTN|nr:TetR/AcrR family transcriptional regulator [Thermomonospora umbrina]REE95931.1 TetR family transcriptional regulator [Thermomonospora umbrina]